MPKRGLTYLVIIALFFSLSVSFVFADKQGTCSNPNGGNYCNGKSQSSDCYCDSQCTNYGDCCSDYKSVCQSGGSSGGGSGKQGDITVTPTKILIIKGHVTQNQISLPEVSLADDGNNQKIGITNKNGDVYFSNYDYAGFLSKTFSNIGIQCAATNDGFAIQCSVPSSIQANGLSIKVHYLANGVDTTETKTGQEINGYYALYLDKEVGSTIINKPPQPPFGLTVSVYEDQNIKTAFLEWQNTNGEAFYIYKNKNDGDFVFIDKTQNKFYHVEPMGKDIKYGYYVTAVNKYGESKPSNYVYVYPQSNVSNTTVSVSEFVKCVFNGYTKEEGCSASNPPASCSGYGTCAAYITGQKGKQVTWKSSCGGYAYTTLDGIDEYAYFNCSSTPTNQSTNQIKCIDTDGGINEFKRGTVKYFSNNVWQTIEDTCEDIDGQTLLEHYCENNQIKNYTFDKCEYGCSLGACLESVPTCYDSDPKNDIYVKGYTTIDNGLTSIYDQCGYEQGYESKNMLIQSYCDGFKLKLNYDYYCPNGCKDGACLQQSQTQLDVQMYKPYVVNNQFTVSAHASSNAPITDVKWSLGDNCGYSESYKLKGPQTYYSADSSADVVCYSPGLKTFYASFYTKDSKAQDKVSIYVEDYSQSNNPPTQANTTQINTTTGGGSNGGSNDQTKKSDTSTSCASRCGKYDASAKCQCDNVCTTYGDCCTDRKTICG